MNWYKKAQLVIKEPENINYIDIGHDFYNQGLQREKSEIKKYPNYLWYYDGNEILSKEEGVGAKRHTTTWKDVNFDYFYAGRYESFTGKITIYKPSNSKNRNIPNIILRKLQDKFPDAVYLYVFD